MGNCYLVTAETTKEFLNEIESNIGEISTFRASAAAYLDHLQFGLDIMGLAPGVGIAPDLLNALISACRGNYGAAGLSVAAAIPIIGEGVTVAKIAKKGTKVLGISKKAGDLSPKAARREAMRQAGIPTSQQPVAQKSFKNKNQEPVGRQYTYEVPKPGGGTEVKSVQHSLTDNVPGHGPHWEAGSVKVNPTRFDPVGRPRLVEGGKSKVNE